MDIKALDELIHVVAGYFAGTDMPLNTVALSIKKGGKFQLRERAEQFFKVRGQMGIVEWPSVETAEAGIRRKLGLQPKDQR